jgi:LmbE family N-acetylglucosaminyl deacetylase
MMALAMLCARPAAAQEVVMDAGRLAHALDRLSGTARVLYIAAHPDDENTRLLAYLANARHVSAMYLSMTRGGGGQNLIGSEQDSLLDALRTQELLAARRLDAARQRFTRMRDFGYSKSAQETLAMWGHDEALADVVLALRTFRPDVVITRFDEQPPNHGHHTASAILAREAFTAAADPSRFPEQLALGIKPWQATRLLHNVPTWRDEPPPKDALAIDVGGYDARLGLSYGELAARSRSQHKSQGFGAAGERGTLIERFVNLAGARATNDILDGVELGWARFGAQGTAVTEALGEARTLLRRDRPEAALPALEKALRALEALPSDDPRVLDARADCARLIAAAAGLFVRATAARPACAPDSVLPAQVEVVLRRPAALKLQRVVFPDGTSATPSEPLGLNEKRVLKADVHCPKDAPISAPYWLAEPPLAGHQVVRDPRLLSDPEGAAPLMTTVELMLGAQPVRLPAPLLYTYTDRVHGERERRVMVVPPATATPVRAAAMFPNGHANAVVLRVRAGADAVKGRVFLDLPEGWRAEPKEHPLALAHAGDEAMLAFQVTPPAGAHVASATPVVEVGGQRYAYREDAIDYPHVPMQVVLQPAKIRLSPLKLAVPRGVIGYVEGSGDSVAADLTHVGMTVEMLDDAALLQGNLSRYAAIVLGVRAYNTRDALRAANPRLFRYVEQGGTLVVQYVTRSGISPLDVPVGPYPLDVGRGRVTDENAAVTALDARDPLLLKPNRIASDDWTGWVQERGLYFGQTWDARYKPLLEMADPGEGAERGALLTARVGRGRYVYTGLSFFRQLPAGVPGAYRLLVNLLSPASSTGTAP